MNTINLTILDLVCIHALIQISYTLGAAKIL